MEFLGIQVLTWHDLVVELHTGLVVFIVMSLGLRLLVDLGARGRPPSVRVIAIRQGTDFVAYFGSAAAVFFLVLSGVTGFYIEPYSSLVAQPILLNKAFVALGALFFWSAFLFLRYWAGPGLWEKKGLYALALITALFGLVFTTLAGSIGAELSIGQSVMDPVYKALSINFHQMTLDTTDVEATAVVMVIAIIVVALAKPSKPNR